MKSWRSQRRRHASSNQPSLPGLSGPFGSPDAKPSSRRFSSPGEFALARARGRLAVVFVGFSLLFVIVSGRLASLTLGSTAHEPAPQQALTGDLPVASRSDIVDRNGMLLATSLPTVTLMADAKKVLNAKEAVEKIGAVLPDIDKAKLLDELTTAKHYVTIRRRLIPKQYFEINKLGIAGLEFVPDESRLYPSGALTSHVVGYTDIDNNGIAGLEKTLDERLKAKPEEPVVTSIDVRLQTIMHRELADAVETYKALGAAGIIMDIKTGEILSLVSLPDFDPQDAGAASDDAKFNRATLGVYEMGSTFKMFNTAMALDSGLIKPAERFDTTHNIEVGGKTIKDYHPSKYWLNVAEIFMESSNIGSARMAEKVGTPRQKAFLSKLGLTEKVKFDLPEIGAPLVPSSANWRETTTMTISFGHGIAVNAIQLVAAAAALVNDGIPVRPTLFKQTEPLPPPDDQQRLVSPRTSAQMRALLRLVVKAGTAKKAEVAGYMIGGKTGTADKLSGHHYAENARMSSFLGVFPINAPRYLVWAILDDPKGTAKTYGFATGGWTAAPLVGHVIGQIGPLLNMPPAEPSVVAASEAQLLRPLGYEVLESLKLTNEMEDYAAVESNRAR